MKKNISYFLVGFSLATILLASCGSKERKDGRTDTTTSGEISFTSDESFSPLMEEFIQIYEGMNRKTKLHPIYTNEVDGINMLINKKTYLTITAKRLTQNQIEYMKANGGLPECFPIAYDGMALICNNQNTDSCITVDNVKRILLGEVKNWSDINKGSRLGEIWVCFDNPKSSAVNFCTDSILGGKPINSPNIFAANDSKDVIDYVEKTPNAIGIIGSNWLNDKRDTTNTTWKKNITVMSVSKLKEATPYNSYKPYQVYLLNGRYPFVRTIYALLNDPKRGLPWGFSHYMEMPKGQLIVLKTGLLPVRGEITIRDVVVHDD